MSEKLIARWTEDGKPILIRIDINGKAHYPPKDPTSGQGMVTTIAAAEG